MKKILRRSVIVYALIGAFLVGMLTLIVSWAVDGRDWVMYSANTHIYTGGKLISGGTITDRNGNILAKTVDDSRVYHSSQSVRSSLLHTVGDTELFIDRSIQNRYADTLLGYNFITGLHFSSTWDKGNNIQLTVDGDVCAAALEALNGRKGAVCVYNWKTGDIICSVSAPTFDPQNKPDVDASPEKYDGVYINRVLSGLYPPGSTFKIVTAAAALESIPDIQTRTFTCDGAYHAADGDVTCTDVHGEINFETALNKSCNSVFAAIANELGADRLNEQAKKMGFGSAQKVDDIEVNKSSFDASGTGPADLGWAGIGQYTTLTTPFHMMNMMGAIANGGQGVKPHLIKNVTLPFRIPIQWASASKNGRILEQSVADTLAEMMHSNVVNNYGQKSFPGLDICAKTGTAEVGGDKEPHSWIVGFVRDEDCPLAFAVVVENGGWGMKSAGPVANTVLQKAKDKLAVSGKK
nr:penicillin-binding transpeptidase domain-containing protein [uncultured Solibaculum sp.]